MARKINIAMWAMSNGQIAVVDVSYPTFSDMKKEYVLSVQPTTVDERGMHRYLPRQGYRLSLEGATRFSEKRLDVLSQSPDTFNFARKMFQRCEDDVKEGKW
jgi:hypothetical protein